MSYQLHIISAAEHDLIRAVDYIEFTLKNSDAADKLLDNATEQVNSFSDLPQKFHLVNDPVLASWGIRSVIINNYLAFYTIDEEKQLEFHSSTGIFPRLRNLFIADSFLFVFSLNVSIINYTFFPIIVSISEIVFFQK